MLTWVNLHHVGIPPVRVFLRQWRQDPRACRDRSTCIIRHPSTPRHILFFLIIITTWITVIKLQWQREASLFLQQRAPGNPTPQRHYNGVSVAITLQMSADTSDPFNYWGITVGSGCFYHHVRGSGFAAGGVTVVQTVQTCWGWPVLVWGHLDELISLRMVSYRLSQFSLLKQYQPPGRRSHRNMFMWGMTGEIYQNWWNWSLILTL